MCVSLLSCGEKKRLLVEKGRQLQEQKSQSNIKISTVLWHYKDHVAIQVGMNEDANLNYWQMELCPCLQTYTETGDVALVLTGLQSGSTSIATLTSP